MFCSGFENGAGFEKRLDPVAAVLPANAGVFWAALRGPCHAATTDDTLGEVLHVSACPLKAVTSMLLSSSSWDVYLANAEWPGIAAEPFLLLCSE
jgi:hypothetical protein